MLTDHTMSSFIFHFLSLTFCYCQQWLCDWRSWRINCSHGNETATSCKPVGFRLWAPVGGALKWRPRLAPKRVLPKLTFYWCRTNRPSLNSESLCVTRQKGGSHTAHGRHCTLFILDLLYMVMREIFMAKLVSAFGKDIYFYLHGTH